MSSPWNPYAAPQPEPAPARAPALHGAAAPQPWSSGEVLTTAMARFKENWAMAFFPWLITAALPEGVSRIPDILRSAHAWPEGTGPAILAWLIFFAARMAVALFLQVGSIRILLQIARGESPQFATLFSGADRYGALLGASALMWLAIGGSLLFFVVPGIIVGIGLSLMQFYVVDANMGPVEALKASWEATRGQKANLLGFSLVCGFAALLGVVALIVGLFVALPVIAIASVVVYTRISGLGVVPPSPSRHPAPLPAR